MYMCGDVVHYKANYLGIFLVKSPFSYERKEMNLLFLFLKIIYSPTTTVLKDQ